MRYIKFGDYHSYNDFALILTGITIESAEAKTEYVDIPCGDGRLDLTEYFGRINYYDRKLTFTFQTKKRHEDFYELYETISNAINGKRLNIIIDRDTSVYWDGRIQMNDYKSNERIGTIEIETICSPYKMEVAETVETVEVDGTIEVDLVNLRKNVSPSVTIVAVSEPIKVIFNGTTYSCNSGTFNFPELVLVEGSNKVTLSGSGTVTFTYRRGKL